MVNSETSSPDVRAVTRHWLLNAVVECSHKLTRLFPVVDSQALNVHEVPGAKVEDYAAALLDLLETRMIVFKSESASDDLNTISGASRLLDRFLAFSQENPPPSGDWRAIRHFWQQPRDIPVVRFGLAALGGEEWERVAMPNWDHFCTVSHDYETGDIISRNLDLLMARLGWFEKGEAEIRIDLDSVRIQKYPEYQALYWKVLPDVYRATFSLERAASGWDPWEHGKDSKWFTEWWLGGDMWYRKPWELPDWPG
jgi:hypothetical protein